MPRTSASAGVSRRTVLRTTALGALATAAGVTDVDDVFGQARQAPPNIVYIMADDLGYAERLACGQSIGSGVVEEPSKQVIGHRMTRRNISWTFESGQNASR